MSQNEVNPPFTKADLDFVTQYVMSTYFSQELNAYRKLYWYANVGYKLCYYIH